MTPSELILSRLRNVVEKTSLPKVSGEPVSKAWVAECPSHDDHHPSLSILERVDGSVSFKCWTGCRTREVVAALGLELGDLFPPNPKSHTQKPGALPFVPWRSVFLNIRDDLKVTHLFLTDLLNRKDFINALVALDVSSEADIQAMRKHVERLGRIAEGVLDGKR